MRRSSLMHTTAARRAFALTIRALIIGALCAAPLSALPSAAPVHAQGGGTGPGSGAGTGSHVVQPGENLYRIALRYNISVEALMAANGLTDADLVVAGQTLVIPGGAAPVEAAPPAPVSAPAAGTDAANMADVDDLGILPVNPSPGDAAAPAAPLPEPAAWLAEGGYISTGGPGVRAIYLRGQALGNDPHAFSKIGDCNSEPPFFLAKFDKGEYDLGPYGYLAPVLEHFAGSFLRQGAAVWTGNHAWGLFDPVWANPAMCEPGETPLACEFRLQRPSVVLIRLGTNEAGSSALFEEHLRRIVEFSIERGTIPVLGTKADRIEGSDLHNAIIRQLAAEYAVPLWDFGRAAERLPGRGLFSDGFHMTYAPPYYTLPGVLATGHGLQNLMALMVLHAVWRTALY